MTPPQCHFKTEQDQIRRKVTYQNILRADVSEIVVCAL
ncbi:hypothetical protein B4129_2709 [Bacillus safensis]|nr:hypothetical protein B4129_2709 [Bacillus safensis]